MVRTDAVAQSFSLLLPSFKFHHMNPTYSQNDLLINSLQCNQAVTSPFLHSHNIPEDIFRSPGSPWIAIGPSRWWRHKTEAKIVVRSTRKATVTTIQNWRMVDRSLAKWTNESYKSLQQTHTGLLHSACNRDLASLIHFWCCHGTSGMRAISLGQR